MRVEGVALWYQTRQLGLQITLCRRIRILLDQQARRSVLYENRAQPFRKTRSRHDV